MTVLFYNDALKSIPYAHMLDISALEYNDDMIFKLPYQEPFIGNYMIQALHGGVLCSFLEIIASVTAKIDIQLDHMPKIINVNYNFMKPALGGQDVYGRAEIIKSGKRILSVSATAYNSLEGNPLTILHANFLS